MTEIPPNNDSGNLRQPKLNLRPPKLNSRRELPPVSTLLGFITVGIIVIFATGFIVQRIAISHTMPVAVATATKTIIPVATTTEVATSTITTTPTEVSGTLSPTPIIPTEVPNTTATPVLIIVVATPGITPIPTAYNPLIDFRGGFANGSSMQMNNGTTTISGKLRLTDGHQNEAHSAFYKTAVPINSFTTSFDYQSIAASAQGITFTIQGVSPTRVGGTGANLGYGTITHSIAIKFALVPTHHSINSSTGVYINGAMPSLPESAISGIDLHSEHTIRVDISYDGTTLNVQETDKVTQSATSQTYMVNIPNVIGTSSAYVGFTGATGTNTSIQDILDWFYQH